MYVADPGTPDAVPLTEAFEDDPPPPPPTAPVGSPEPPTMFTVVVLVDVTHVN
jgi:hypothetical protein